MNQNNKPECVAPHPCNLTRNCMSEVSNLEPSIRTVYVCEPGMSPGLTATVSVRLQFASTMLGIGV